MTTTHNVTNLTRLTGHDAIAYADEWGLELSKYTDPTEGARTGLTVDEARAIAAEDASLIYLDVPTESDEEDDWRFFVVIDGEPVNVTTDAQWDAAAAALAERGIAHTPVYACPGDPDSPDSYRTERKLLAAER